MKNAIKIIVSMLVMAIVAWSCAKTESPRSPRGLFLYRERPASIRDYKKSNQPASGNGKLGPQLLSLCFDRLIMVCSWG